MTENRRLKEKLALQATVPTAFMQLAGFNVICV